MIKKHIKEFDLKKIAISGQCFRMGELQNGRFFVKALGKYLELEQEDTCVTFYCSEEAYETIWKSYFDLETDYESIRNAIDPEDAYLTKSASLASGMRILRQDLWEMLITFIISQQNNIPRIKKCVEKLCERYGGQVTCEDGATFYGFPTASRLAQCSQEELRALGLGYRAKYIQKTAQMVANGEVDLVRMAELPYEEAKKELLKFCGVGIKVAECVCLYALHHVDAFPIDTHIQDMLNENYPDGFPFERYKGYAGILQQYGFYYELHGKKGTK